MPTLPWTAPKTLPPGETLPPGAGSATVMASRLELRRLRDVPSFFSAALRIRQQMLGSPGVLGVSLVAKPARRTFWTLSAWQDEAALSAAVGREPHKQLMNHFRPRMAGSAFVTWTAPATALPIAWDEALQRLESQERAGLLRAPRLGTIRSLGTVPWLRAAAIPPYHIWNDSLGRVPYMENSPINSVYGNDG